MFQPIGLPAARVVERLKVKYPLDWSAEIIADAEQLAAQHGYDSGALRFQADRRSHGSYTTTLDGSTRERDRYRRAWQVAMAREAIREQQAAERERCSSAIEDFGRAVTGNAR